MDGTIALIIPAHNEEEPLPRVLAEIRETLDLERFPVAVGANGCADGTVDVAREGGAVVGVTRETGYGHGCVAAIRAIRKRRQPDAYAFVAADGASDPRDILRIAEAFRAGGSLGMVLGQRRPAPDFAMTRTLENRVMGVLVGLLTGRFFRDIGPLRIISRIAYERMNPREMTYGWTIEAQVLAVRLGLPIREVAVTERRRLAGEQKVSHHSLGRSIAVAALMTRAALRARFRAPGPNSRSQ